MANPAEHMASKVMGAAKTAKAALEGLSGVFRHLATEHGEATALLLRVKASSDPKVRAKLFPEIRKELLSHEKGELAVVYPAINQLPGLKTISEQHAREADQLDRAITTVGTLAWDDPNWETAFNALVTLVSQHVKEEENDWFPSAQKELGRERSEELLKEFEQAKQAAKAAL